MTPWREWRAQRYSRAQRESRTQPALAGSASVPPTVGYDIAAALLVAVLPLVCLMLLDGMPTDFSGWTALFGPLAGGAAILACRRDVRIAVLLLTLALLCAPAADKVFGVPSSPWVGFVSLAPVIAAAWVSCALGSTLALMPSLLWLSASVGISWWALGGDALYLMLGVGWWLIGRVLQSRRSVADDLRIRATELTAERDRFTAEAIRQERAEIARELHDVVAHCMTVIVIQARAGQHLLGRDPAAAQDVMDVIVAVTKEAETDIGALVELMDPHRTRRLSPQLLDELVTRAARTGATIVVEISGDPDDLGPEVAVAAHRLVQESLTNAFRHAPGSAVVIDLRCMPPVELAVTNERPVPTGLSAQLHRSGAGRGLVGVRERVAALGGQATWGPTPSGGWRVHAYLTPP